MFWLQKIKTPLIAPIGQAGFSASLQNFIKYMFLTLGCIHILSCNKESFLSDCGRWSLRILETLAQQFLLWECMWRKSFVRYLNIGRHFYGGILKTSVRGYVTNCLHHLGWSKVFFLPSRSCCPRLSSKVSKVQSVHLLAAYIKSCSRKASHHVLICLQHLRVSSIQALCTLNAVLASSAHI